MNVNKNQEGTARNIFFKLLMMQCIGGQVKPSTYSSDYTEYTYKHIVQIINDAHILQIIQNISSDYSEYTTTADKENDKKKRKEMK